MRSVGGRDPDVLWADFVRFARAQLRSGDIDPTYPVLAASYAREGISREVALWRTLLFVTTYHLGYAKHLWRNVAPEPRSLDFTDFVGLVTGIERRGFRGRPDHAARFVNDVLDEAGGPHGSLGAWVDSFGTGESGWDRAREGLRNARGAGPWAAYKWADLLAHVHDLDITASDLGVGGASETAGPIPGMVLLTGKSWKVCATDVDLQRSLLAKSLAAGVPFSGLDQLETALCDFNSLVKGGYYVGHDIDDQMTKLAGCGPLLWEARSVFPDAYRGEFGGWVGVRKDLKTAYRDRGLVLHAD